MGSTTMLATECRVKMLHLCKTIFKRFLLSSALSRLFSATVDTVVGEGDGNPLGASDVLGSTDGDELGLDEIETLGLELILDGSSLVSELEDWLGELVGAEDRVGFNEGVSETTWLGTLLRTALGFAD